MSWKKYFLELAQPADRRIAPVFKPYHAVVALMMIGRQQPVGRYELCQNLSIGEGSVRTLLKRLTDAGYITADGKQGQRLTNKGRKLFERITKDIPLGLFLELDSLAIFEYAFANLVKDRAEYVTDGINQRDEAIIQCGHNRAGATTIVMKNGMLVMPPDNYNVLLSNENEVLLILESLSPEDNDVIVIGSSDEANVAREVSMAAVLTLFEDD